MCPAGVFTKMRGVLLAAVAVVLVGTTVVSRSHATIAVPMYAEKTPAPAPVLGISYRGALAWFDPMTLRMLPGRKAPLRGHFGSWAFSGDRSVVAIARCNDAGSRPGIRFVNARAMRVLGDVRLSKYRGCASSLTWLQHNRLLAVVDVAGSRELVVVDPVRRSVVRRELLPSAWSVALGRTRNELVLLLGNSEIVPARLAIAGPDGHLRTRIVDEVLEGTVVDEQSLDHRSRMVLPGLAVDPGGRQAFLVPARGPIAQIDLETLALSYHEPDPPSLLERFRRWLTPSAQAKAIEGPAREARWLGGGMIAVSGMDYSIRVNAQGEPLEERAPAGLRLVDTTSWRTRVLSLGASTFAVAGGLVITADAQSSEHGSVPGISAFDFDGSVQWWRLTQAESPGWMDSVGSVGYVYRDQWTADVVDLTTGETMSTVRSNENPFPKLLATQSADW